MVVCYSGSETNPSLQRNWKWSCLHYGTHLVGWKWFPLGSGNFEFRFNTVEDLCVTWSMDSINLKPGFH